MAGRKRDIELVIRAKNEAEKVVNAVSAAMDDFTNAQRELTTQAGKTDSALGKMGAAFGALDKAAKDLQIDEKIGREMRSAADSMKVLEGRVAETSAELRDLEGRAQKSSKSLGEMRAASSKTSQVIDRVSASVKKQKAELRSNTTALGRAEKAQDKLASRFQKLNTEIKSNETAVANARSRYSDLAARMEATDQPTKRLVNSFEAAERRIERTSAALEKSKTAFQDVQDRQAATATEVKRLRSALESGQASLSKQEGELKKLSNAHRDLKGAIREAAKEDKALSDSVDSVTNALRKQERQIQDAATSYAKLEEAGAQARAQIGALGDASRGNLESILLQQAEAAVRLRSEYQELRGTADGLEATIGRLGVPTREQAQALRFAAQAADEAELKFMAQQETVERLGRVYRDTGQDIQSIASAQQVFAKEVGRGGAALRELTEDGLKARNSLRSLSKAENDAAASSKRVATASENATRARRKELSVLQQLRAANQGLYGGSRQSLSFLQRIRGEVLSLAAAYGGLFGAIQGGAQSIAAVGTIEGVQSRLQVANEGDEAQTASDMDYLRRMANRLGVELGNLGTEYSKLAVATKGTNLEGEETRKLFRRITEAARVNRSSNEQLQAVFTALTQIVSKGAVQMEELRQQLGDRLPGALQIMADGLGVTTAELVKMMEQGQVSADALIPFGEEMEKRFGPQLASSLQSSTVQIGRLKNALFETMLAFGRGGFVDGVIEFSQRVTEVLRSGEFLSFLDRASSAAQGLMQLLALMVENFQLLGVAAGAFVGIKLVPYVFALGAAMKKAGGSAVSLAGDMRTASTATTAAGVSAGRATVAFRGLTAAVRTFFASTGVGLAVVAATTAMGHFITSTDDAIDVATRHRDIMDEVRNAYEAAGGELEEYQKILKESGKVTKTEIKRTIEDAQAALANAKSGMDEVLANEGSSIWNRVYSDSNVTIAFSRASQDIQNALKAVVDAYENGEIAVEDYVDAVDNAVSEYRDFSAANARYADGAVKFARATVKNEEIIRDLGNALGTTSEDAEEAESALKELDDTTEEVGESAKNAAQQHEKFQSALAALKSTMPELTTEMDKFRAKIDEIESSFKRALAEARAMPDAIQRIAAEQAALEARDMAINAATATMGPTRDRIQTVAQSAIGMREGQASLREFLTSGGQNIDPEKVEWCAAFMNAVLNGAGIQGTGRLNAQSYLNWGSDVGGIESAQPGDVVVFERGAPGGWQGHVGIYQGMTEDGKIRVLGGNQRDGVNVSNYSTDRLLGVRRAIGEETPAGTQVDALGQQAADDLRRDQERAAQERQNQRDATRQRIEDGQFEIEQQQRLNDGRERQVEIEAALRDARQENPNITQEELDRIAEMTGQTFDLALAREKAAEAAKLAAEGTTAEQQAALQAAQVAQQEVDDLLSIQGELRTQINLATESGDQEEVDLLKSKLEEVNAQLILAIENAKQMWGAVGGTAADAATAKLNTAAMNAQKLGQDGQQAFIDWKRVGDLFASGLANAFNSFSKAVAEGKSKGEAARTAFLQFAADFLLQIGQMIVQQAILNALRGAGQNGGILGQMFPAATGHTGGMVGSSRVGSGNSSRPVSIAAFAGAMRYHQGGMPGLRPNEVPIIAKKGEEVLSESDPRNAMNGGEVPTRASGSSEPTIINAFDAEGFLDAALSSRRGQKLLLNFVRANGSDVKRALG